MRIAILSRNAEIYSTRRLSEACEARGHHVDILDALAVTLEIDPAGPRLYYGALPLAAYDAVIPRIGASISLYGLAVLRQMEELGTYALNGTDAVALAQDKLASSQRLAGAGLPLPVTAFAHDARHSDHLVALVGGAPVIVKQIEGTQGVGVVLAESERSARSVIEAFRGAQVDILVQRFVEEAGSRDLRVFVVGNEVVAAMERQGSGDDFRANIHRGGSAEQVPISDQERDVALRAASAVGLKVAGVDMLRANAGPQIMEVNSTPGLEGIEGASGVDIAEKMVAFLERELSAGPAG